MNRKQRRKQQREMAKKLSKEVYNQEVIKNEIKKNIIEKEVTQKMFIMMLTLPLTVLRKEFKFGKSRLEKFSENMLTLFKDVEDEKISINDLKELLEKETGFIIKTENR